MPRQDSEALVDPVAAELLGASSCLSFLESGRWVFPGLAREPLLRLLRVRPGENPLQLHPAYHRYDPFRPQPTIIAVILVSQPMEDPGKPGVPGRLAGDNRPPFPPNHSRQRQNLFRFVLFSFEGSRGVTPKPGEQDPVSTQSGTSQAKSPNRRKTIGFSRACEAHSFAPGPDISLWCKVTRKTMLVLSSLRKDPLRLFGENKVQSR